MRVSVIGCSGAGKTTFGRALAARLDAPFIELDSIFHGPHWTPLSEDEFRARVEPITAGETWVIDGNYGAVRPIVLARATTVVWLDFSRGRVMTRVIRRSVARAITRRELWNGNKEDFRNFLEPDHPIWWAWSQHGRKRAEYAARFTQPEYANIDVNRFHTPRAAEEWLHWVG